MGLFLLFFSAIGSYIGWSSRHFLMIPTLQFESDIPEDARREASRWHDDQDFFKPEKFSWSRMVHYLQYPWDKGPSPIKVRLVQDDLILSVFIHHASRGSDGVELSKDGLVYVADRSNRRIQVFDQSGKSLDTWPNLRQPNDIFLSDDGNVWVVDGTNARLLQFHKNGKRLY